MSLPSEERRLRTTPINTPATNRPVTTASSNITVCTLLSDYWIENRWSNLLNCVGAGNSFAALLRLHQEFRLAAVPGGAACSPLAARGAGRKKETVKYKCATSHSPHCPANANRCTLRRLARRASSSLAQIAAYHCYRQTRGEPSDSPVVSWRGEAPLGIAFLVGHQGTAGPSPAIYAVFSSI